MPLRVNRSIIMAKIEPTPGTDSSPVVGTDAILVENIATNLEALRMEKRPVVTQIIGKRQDQYGGSLRKVTFDTEIKGASAVYSSSVFPEIDPLFRASSLGATGDFTASSEKWTYQVISSSQEYITLYFNCDGILYALTGCQGKPSIVYKAGVRAMISWEFIGHSVAPTDVALGTGVYDTHAPPVVLGSTFTVGGYAAVISQLDVDLGNIIANRDSVAASDGYALGIIADRDVQGSMDPEAVLVATNDFEGHLRAGTQNTIVMGSVGAAQYNKHTTTLLRSYYRDIGLGDRNAVRTFSTPFGCDASSEDEFTIVFD